ncbi:MAG: discoidin domain-containing protein [Muribaculaceae bacterium]|nr:discoidin domain-containing protein [Muribaculaceae bacterium]
MQEIMKEKHLIFILVAMMTLETTAQVMNRPIGQYPGNPSEYYGPELGQDNSYGGDLALHRIVYQSSCWDYNLTSMLLTDGIIDKHLPAWLNVTTPEGQLPPHKREACIDGNEWTCNILMGGNTWLQYDWENMVIDIDEVEMVCNMAYRDGSPQGFKIRLLTSKDGKKWKVADEWKGDSLPGEPSWNRVHSDPNKNSGDNLLPTRNIDHTFHLNGKPFSHMKLEMVTPAAAHWTITELKMRKDGNRAKGILPSEHFVSAWRSMGIENEWVTVDLGAQATINGIGLSWINKPSRGNIQVSDDNINWKIIATLSKNKDELIKLDDETGRYVRINMIEPSPNRQPFCLKEVIIAGKGGAKAIPHEAGGWDGSKWLLNGGNWRLQRASHAGPMNNPQYIVHNGFYEEGLPATVPATVLSSYVNARALPDMNHDDNLMLASESFFNGDFIYKRSFDLPREMQGKRVFLNFDGINWKAEVTLNGTNLGRIDGAFKRGKFDITPYLKVKGNELRVVIIANANPGGVKVKTEKNTDFNGGILGADNPTFHATIGWDWISTIRGRDIGIWDDVYLTATSDVSVSDPVVTTTLAEGDTLATMTPAVMLTNHALHPVTGTLHGHIGDICFEKPVTLAAGQKVEESFNPDEFTQLKDQRMRLWWPNGYGEPYLHDASFSFTIDGVQSDAIEYKAGIREVKTVDKDTKLRIYINNRRLVPLGGNWAFSENNLNYRGREFDAAVRHHKEMNYNMIRNWVGMTGDKEFYEACDRYGIMVWQDFWLANPADGPDPDDEAMFMDNARDLVLKIRNHPCIGIYCGRNEGYPPKTLDDGLRNTVASLHPGLDYISSSADDGVSGHGPYWAITPKEYFENQTGKLHSERGMPNVMTYEGLSRTLDAEHLWPQNLYWGRHDYTMEGAQRGASFNQLIADNFGEPTSAQEFCEWAQWINYEGYRAMYESGSRDRMGLLIWMSHPCWPSMVWQTYDYYLEPTAAYYGVKHACEPLHVQWNPVSNHVEIVNRSAGHQQGKVKASIIDLNGKTLWEQVQGYVIDEDMTLDMMQVEVPADIAGAYFLRLTLTDDKGHVRSVNDYVRTTVENDRTSLHDLRLAQVNATVKGKSITLLNNGNTPAVMLRLNLKGSDGEQILPAIYSDNYFHLMPGESRTISIDWKYEDTRGSHPIIEISGMNVTKTTVDL